jgi:hypothetical protein
MSDTPFIFSTAISMHVVNVIFATIWSVNKNVSFATDIYHLQTLSGSPLSEIARVDLHNTIFEVMYG